MTNPESLSPPAMDDAQVKKRRKNAGFERLGLRIKDVTRFFQRRWGTMLPNDDDGRLAAYVLIAHLQNGRDPETKIVAQIALWAPWMTDAERDSLRTRALAEDPRWDADQFAELFQVTEAERAGPPVLKTIGVAGKTSADRTRRREERKRDAKKLARQKAALRRAADAKIKPSRWSREMAVLDSLPQGRAFVTVSSVVTLLEGHEKFQGVSVKAAVHRAIDGLESRGAVVKQILRTPGKMTFVARIRRTSAEERATLEPPTDAAGYLRLIRAKCILVGPARAKEFYGRSEQYEFQEKLGLTHEQHYAIVQMLDAFAKSKGRR